MIIYYQTKKVGYFKNQIFINIFAYMSDVGNQLGAQWVPNPSTIIPRVKNSKAKFHAIEYNQATATPS